MRTIAYAALALLVATPAYAKNDCVTYVGDIYLKKQAQINKLDQRSNSLANEKRVRFSNAHNERQLRERIKFCQRGL